LNDADYAAALQNLSATRYKGLMDAAWGTAVGRRIAHDSFF
jgi:hypothetical protein